jgi:hypothetical protein
VTDARPSAHPAASVVPGDPLRGSPLLHLTMALALIGGLGPAQAAADPDAEPAAATAAAAPNQDDGAAATATDAEEADAAPRARGVSPLERRVMLLTKELGLTAGQQLRVKQVLELQREEVTRVWSDTSIPAARRVAATQAVGDRTAARIRALLDEEQRRKYLKPRRREAAVGAGGADAAAWMNAAGSPAPRP